MKRAYLMNEASVRAPIGTGWVKWLYTSLASNILGIQTKLKLEHIFMHLKEVLKVPGRATDSLPEDPAAYRLLSQKTGSD